MMFSWLVHVIACIKKEDWIVFHYRALPRFVYPFVSWWTFKQFSLCSYYECIVVTLYKFLCEHTFSVGEGSGTPLQYSCLKNPMDGGAWSAAVHGVMKSRTGLSDFTFTFHFHALEKQMATHSSAVVWRILGTAEPGGLPSMGSHRVGHDWSDLAPAPAAWSSTVSVLH